ncbi:MAG: hypothetical protein EAZ35_02345 [Sphingobacteriia bacterium]|nr:MAG: hypothetical protein EAZ35_02345 [Sphingobacteriia bacterium]
MQVRKFLVTTAVSPEGVVYSYASDTEKIVAFEIKQENIKAVAMQWLLDNLKPTLNDFLTWVKSFKCEVVEIHQKISFDMFWNQYNDGSRSSKKRSLSVWNKLKEEDQIKAYYYYPKYNKNRGNAEKKYCETYLNAELWNN